MTAARHPGYPLPVDENANQTPPEDRPRARHDLGGVSRFMCEPVDTAPHALTAFDRQVDALRQILGMKGIMSVDELRRGVEALTEAEYFGLSYYQRWMRAISATLLRKSVITEAELRNTLSEMP